jgi:DNA replication licensing factor MCM6
LGISPAIMSRFDLFFIVQDECNEEIDEKIAQHIVEVHANKGNKKNINYSMEEIKLYLKYGKTIKPIVKYFIKNIVVRRFKKIIS